MVKGLTLTSPNARNYVKSREYWTEFFKDYGPLTGKSAEGQQRFMERWIEQIGRVFKEYGGLNKDGWTISINRPLERIYETRQIDDVELRVEVETVYWSFRAKYTLTFDDMLERDLLYFVQDLIRRIKEVAIKRE